MDNSDEQNRLRKIFYGQARKAGMSPDEFQRRVCEGIDKEMEAMVENLELGQSTISEKIDGAATDKSIYCADKEKH